jgi:mannose-6-phosphate isomerase-like protein (cupin superfamily)
MNEFRKIKKEEARIFFEGKEMCREYCSTGKITFGTSRLFPGEEGAVDPGHAEAHEVFFVVDGRVVMSNENGLFVELGKGDALLVTENVPHKIYNISDQIALLSWSCAPKP